MCYVFLIFTLCASLQIKLIGTLFEVAHSDEGTTLGINPGGPIGCTNPQPKCSQNQIYSLCGRLCEPSCENPHLFCPRIACTKKRAGCRCSVGFLRRASDDACVKADDCCKPSPHDVYSNSSDWCCEATCKSDDPCNGTVKIWHLKYT